VFEAVDPRGRRGRLANAIPSSKAVTGAHLPRGGPRRRVVEDPEALGYRLVADPLLEIMDAERWYSLERAARG
jgi:hypothetical protein